MSAMATHLGRIETTGIRSLDIWTPDAMTGSDVKIINHVVYLNLWEIYDAATLTYLTVRNNGGKQTLDEIKKLPMFDFYSSGWY
jgi:hypothetical protein